MKPVVQFLFDVASPNAYLVHSTLPALSARTGVAVEYVPVLLGGLFKLANNRSPAEMYAAVPNRIAYERVEIQRFLERYRLQDFRMNPHFPLNTLQVMRAVIAAEQQSAAPRFIEAAFQAMWEQGKKLDDLAVLASVASDAGLDTDRLFSDAESDEVKSTLLQNTEAAYKRGAFGVPTVFVDDQMYFGKERLGSIEEEILRRML